jgi:hypothetical protein
MRRRQAVLALGIAVTAVGLGACGDDGDERATKARPKQAEKTILIKTRLNIPTGEVAAGSRIGDSAFCAGGTFRDRETSDDEGTVARTFRCRDGSLKITFTAKSLPGTSSDTQSGAWIVQSGTGRFKDLRGDGRMNVKFTSENRGRETFTGTVAE